MPATRARVAMAKSMFGSGRDLWLIAGYPRQLALLFPGQV
jgi:hypothetical protein